MFRCLIVGHYSKQDEKDEHDESLRFLLRNLHQSYKDTPILILGDFNRSREDMTQIEEITNCSLLQSQEENQHTWQCGSRKSEIDFILSTGQCEKTEAQ